MPYLSALKVCSRQGAIQIHIYLTLHYLGAIKLKVIRNSSPGQTSTQQYSQQPTCIVLFSRQEETAIVLIETCVTTFYNQHFYGQRLSDANRVYDVPTACVHLLLVSD